jgi:phosphatidylinositol 3-kinase
VIIIFNFIFIGCYDVLFVREKSFEHRYVREYAVEILRNASDDQLLLFLLQLVQALRYEPTTPQIATNTSAEQSKSNYMPDADHPAATMVESDGTKATPPSIQSPIEPIPVVTATDISDKASNLSPLGRFLVDRACSSPTVANYLYWYLKVETQSDEDNSNSVFNSSWETFVVQLSERSDTKMLHKRLMALDDYITQISEAHKQAIKMRVRKDAKQQALIKTLEVKGLSNGQGFDWMPMPLNPDVKITGILPEKTFMFASAMTPAVIWFKEVVIPPSQSVEFDGNDQLPPPVFRARESVKLHKVIFKSGDDLRQDQLVMQMISLMDSELKKVNLDLKLLTYGILAVGPKDGIMEFVENSKAVSAIEKEGTITDFLRKNNPDNDGPYGIAPA